MIEQKKWQIYKHINIHFYVSDDKFNEELINFFIKIWDDIIFI